MASELVNLEEGEYLNAQFQICQKVKYELNEVNLEKWEVSSR